MIVACPLNTGDRCVGVPSGSDPGIEKSSVMYGLVDYVVLVMGIECNYNSLKI